MTTINKGKFETLERGDTVVLDYINDDSKTWRGLATVEACIPTLGQRCWRVRTRGEDAVGFFTRDELIFFERPAPTKMFTLTVIEDSTDRLYASTKCLNRYIRESYHIVAEFATATEWPVWVQLEEVTE